MRKQVSLDLCAPEQAGYFGAPLEQEPEVPTPTAPSEEAIAPGLLAGEEDEKSEVTTPQMRSSFSCYFSSRRPSNFQEETTVEPMVLRLQ
jgi:hypothetical protein